MNQAVVDLEESWGEQYDTAKENHDVTEMWRLRGLLTEWGICKHRSDLCGLEGRCYCYKHNN